MRPRVLFSAPFDFLGPLAPYDGLFSMDFIEVWRVQELPEDVGYEYWVPNPGQHFVIDGQVVARFPELKMIVSPSTGTNHIARDACAAAGVGVASLLDDREALELISASAEFSFLHVLNALRRIDLGLMAVGGGEWRDDEGRFRGNELAGRRAGLVGYGRIGRRLARYFQAFDVAVRVYDPHVKIAEGVEEAGSLEQLFECCDVVVVCCALTEATRGMIGADHLERLPKGAVLVNTARGEILREREVVDVLSRRPDLRFSADVVAGEVTGSQFDSPLIAAHRGGRALITPHIAGATVESQRRAARSACALIARNARMAGDVFESRTKESNI